jgi:hypothetical protein
VEGKAPPSSEKISECPQSIPQSIPFSVWPVPALETNEVGPSLPGSKQIFRGASPFHTSPFHTCLFNDLLGHQALASMRP